MNQQERQQYQEKYRRRMLMFERRLLRPIYDALQAQMKQAADIIKSSGPDGLRIRLENLMFVQDLAPAIRDIWLMVGVYSARKTLREINASAREAKAGFGVDEKFTRAVLDYLEKYLLVKAVLPISQTTKEQILALLEKGRREGWGIDKMVFELENSDITLSRARMILRTELIMAENKGKELGREESPFESTKQWISAHDHRVRHSHRNIDGETIDVKGRFKVDRYKGKRYVGFDMMTGPGDPMASPENIIQCRCTTAERAKRDENGRLIRKRKSTSVIMPGEFIQRQIVTI